MSWGQIKVCNDGGGVKKKLRKNAMGGRRKKGEKNPLDTTKQKVVAVRDHTTRKRRRSLRIFVRLFVDERKEKPVKQDGGSIQTEGDPNKQVKDPLGGKGELRPYLPAKLQERSRGSKTSHRHEIEKP